MDKLPCNLHIFSSVNERTEWERSFGSHVDIGWGNGVAVLDGMFRLDDLREIVDKVEKIQQAQTKHASSS